MGLRFDAKGKSSNRDNEITSQSDYEPQIGIP